MIEAIDLLVLTRSRLNIPEKDLFLFPAPSKQSTNCLRGYQVLGNVIARVEGLESPEYIKSTKLRKYVATVTQISSLFKTEMEWLCRHMGHSPETHKQYYRMQDSAIELSKVSRLLLAVDSDAGEEIGNYYFILCPIIIFYYCSSFPQILICSLTLLIKLAKTELEIFGQTID